MSDERRRAGAERAIRLIDLTDLADDHSPAGITELCRRAAAHRTAAVCVWPEFVATCAAALAGTDVRVATVVNFPTGDEPVDEVVEATVRAIADGADDIDVVLPWRALAAGDGVAAESLVEAVVAAVRSSPGGEGIVVKVILETGEADSVDEIARRSQLAIAAGADFIKTSTGKTAHGASLEAARTMLGEIAAAGRVVGLKPSGGIRTDDDAAAYLALADEVMGNGWATPATFRFGASGLLDALVAVVDSHDVSPSDDGY